MSRPRRVLPGTTHLITRRVAQRVFLLSPTAECRQIVRYCFGRAQELYPGVALHALQVLSNHYHAHLTDEDGTLPLFMAWVDREIGKAMNELYDLRENFWSNEAYSSQELTDFEACWDKLLYVFTNVVKAGLVRDYREWPGVHSTPRDWLLPPQVIERPSVYFSQRNPRWASVRLRFTPPPQLREREPEQAVREVEAGIEQRQREQRTQARLAGKRFIGAERILKQSPFAQPKTPHVKGKLKPTFAAGTAEGQRRAREERKAFLGAYREALAALKRGLRCAFPSGSYHWPRLLGLPCVALETAHTSADTG